ncbi:MAG: GYD family protein [Verrucomicrobia bacterium]|nr:MAG: GYD family protein [Verrucomicrobiota bacterium]
MARYVTLIRLTEQGAKGIKKSTGRARAFREAAGKAGVRVEAQYWTTGGYDGLLVVSAADEKNVLRCLTELAAAGNVHTETLQAFDAREFESIVGKRSSSIRPN